MSDDKRRDRARSDPARLNTLLGAVLELSHEERERWLDESSAGNSGLRDQLRAMLRGAQAEAAQGASQSETAYLPPTESREAGSGGSGRGRIPDDHAGDRLVLGQHVGRYEVLDLLGAGGMGRVYRALDASLGREVAIKGLADAFRGDSRSLRRFEREARVLATLSHPNIAAIYGLERVNGSPYLVLERVEGETLANRLARGPVPLEEALAIAVQIVAGLEEAHAKGVIHRDLKPSNVMLAPGRQVKLVDFGLAKTAAVERDAEESIEPITEIGLVVGTARYMSPEQVTGGDVDTRTDVWAFGCVPVRDADRPARVRRALRVRGGRRPPSRRAGLECAAPRCPARRHAPDPAVPAPRSARTPAAHRRRTHRARRPGAGRRVAGVSRGATARAPAAPVADRHRAHHDCAGGRLSAAAA